MTNSRATATRKALPAHACVAQVSQFHLDSKYPERSDLMVRWPYVLQGGNMPTLKAPKQIVFLVSLAVAIVAWISFFAHIPYIGEHPSIFMTLAYVALALGCFL